jgi:murein L,D-transpeptidase YafK
MFFRRNYRILISLKNPLVVIKKSERKLYLFDGEKFVKIYCIVLGFEPKADKKKEGDGRTPEGEFFVVAKNPKSKYFLSLGLNYPTARHAEKGLQADLINQNEFDEILKASEEMRLPKQKTRLGGEIYIHGGGTLWDWTEGCIALENKDMQEIFEIVKIRTRVLIEP